MAENRRAMVKKEASKRGWRATLTGLASAGAIGISAGIGAPFIITAGVTIAGVAWTGLKVRDWLAYRGENGLRF